MLTALIDRNPVFSLATAIYAILLLGFCCALIVDSRMLDGFNVWVKPIKFALSLLVYFATLVWCSQWLAESVTSSDWFRYFNIAMLVFSLVEIVWIASAAAGGNPSHFNTEHPVLAHVYPLMGLIAIALLSATIVYGIAAFAAPSSGNNSDFWRHAIGVSLIVTFISTAITASYLGAQPGHAVGDIDGSMQTGLFGWLRSAGDLRVAHFFAMHTMQLVPLILCCVVLLLPVSQGLPLIYAVTGIYSVFVAATFFQAMSGKPFLPGLL